MKKIKLLGISLVSFTVPASIVITSLLLSRKNKNNNSNAPKHFLNHTSQYDAIDHNTKEASGISIRAMHNMEIRKWILNVEDEGFKDFENDKKSLFRLKIDDDLKAFMLQNLKEKYEIKTLKRKSKTKNNNHPSPGYEKEYFDLNGNRIYKEGRDRGPEIHDYVFADDVSYIWWSNYKIMENIGKTIPPWRIDEIKRDQKELVSLFKFNSKTITSAAWTLGSATWNRTVDKFIKKLKLNSKMLEKLLGFSMGKYAVAGVGSMLDTNSETIIRNLASATFDMLVSTTIHNIGPALLGTPFAPLGFMLIAIDSLCSVVTTGNGFTVWENFGDHGLNDWSFQMKNNFPNMVKTAKSYSENYKYGVEWKVTDGWFSYPELSIRTDSPGEPWHFLSPGTSFNFGNKISLWTKPQNEWLSLVHEGSY